MRIFDVIEDIGLGDAQVLKQMPEGIGQVGRHGIVMRPAGNLRLRVSKEQMRLARGKGVYKLLAQVLVMFIVDSHWDVY